MAINDIIGNGMMNGMGGGTPIGIGVGPTPLGGPSPITNNPVSISVGNTSVVSAQDVSQAINDTTRRNKPQVTANMGGTAGNLSSNVLTAAPGENTISVNAGNDLNNLANVNFSPVGGTLSESDLTPNDTGGSSTDLGLGLGLPGNGTGMTGGGLRAKPPKPGPNYIWNEQMWRWIRVSNNLGDGGTTSKKTSDKIDPIDPLLLTDSKSKIFSFFNAKTDIIRNNTELITKGLWSNGSGSLSTFISGADASNGTINQKQYYIPIYDGDPTSCSSKKQFDIAYGNFNGSGSLSMGGQVNDTPTRAVYSQLKLACIENVTAEQKFTFGDGETEHVYAILFNQDSMKDRVDPGNWQLYLSGSSGEILTLIDDSGDTDETLSNQGAHLTTRVYNVVSGSLVNGVQNTHSYGQFYPDQGIILIDANYLDASASLNTNVSFNTDGDNASKLFFAISGAAQVNQSYTFDARNSQLVTNEYYFIRIAPFEYNYSNNPTFVSGTLGEFRYPYYERNPKTYITTIGLYNDKRELLAVAKASQPMINSFEEEHNIRVKLQY